MLDEVAAFEQAVGRRRAGEVIFRFVIFLIYDRLKPALEVPARRGALPVTDLQTAAQTVSNS